MSSVDAGFGLKPAFHPSGTNRQDMILLIDQTVDFYQYAPVGINATSGALEPIAPAAIDAAPNDFVGVFLGVEWTGTDGRYNFNNQWVADTPIKTNTDIRAYYSRDPRIIYQIQCEGSLTSAAVGKQFTYVLPTPGIHEEITGLSRAVLDSTAGTGTEQAALRVVSLTPGPDNEWGDDYTVVNVIINAHQDVPGRNVAGTPA